jgi:hypothetical protein
VASPDERGLLDGYRAKSFGDWAPQGARLTRTVELTASCATDWPDPRAVIPPAKRKAALEVD